MNQLSAEDQEALRISASDLSDICPCCVARYKRGEAEAYKRADEIREGKRNPLCG